MLVVVALPVCFQAVALGEGPVAEGTPVRLLPAVRPHVDGQVRLAGAAFPADPAHVRFGARVDHEVLVEVALAFEGVAAVRAAVRRLSSVDPQVHGQPPLGGEAPPTLVAAVGPLIGVRPHVDDELLAGQEHLAADVAEVRALPLRVDLLVLLQGAGELEAPPTDLTGVGPLPGVRHLVAGQRPLVAEQFPTDAAEEGSGLAVSPLVVSELPLQAEHLVAGGTSVTRTVELLVVLKCRLQRKRAAAHLAPVRFLPRVCRHMLV